MAKITEMIGTPESEGAFIGIPSQAKPTMYGEELGGLVHCSLCQGHGSWNIKFKTSVFPQQYQYGRMQCPQCSSFGWSQEILG